MDIVLQVWKGVHLPQYEFVHTRNCLGVTVYEYVVDPYKLGCYSVLNLTNVNFKLWKLLALPFSPRNLSGAVRIRLQKLKYFWLSTSEFHNHIFKALNFTLISLFCVHIWWTKWKLCSFQLIFNFRDCRCSLLKIHHQCRHCAAAPSRGTWTNAESCSDPNSEHPRLEDALVTWNITWVHKGFQDLGSTWKSQT